jgi:hypothetical protein
MQAVAPRAVTPVTAGNSNHRHEGRRRRPAAHCASYPHRTFHRAAGALSFLPLPDTLSSSPQLMLAGDEDACSIAFSWIFCGILHAVFQNTLEPSAKSLMYSQSHDQEGNFCNQDVGDLQGGPLDACVILKLMT